MGRILAIDFGKKHIGLAVSDETKTIATGLDTLSYHNKKEVIEKLKQIVKDKEVEKIVLGYPISMSGKITKIGLEVLEFKKFLEQNLSLKIELLDERLTTEISKRIVEQVRRKPTPPKALLDKLSAIIMLQDYLSQIKK
ncbi:MAG: Holliday junction resolvase RuvX [Candidatus Latescibacteria bacterium]|nr:Holliday junction resolvase RuvX [Candidatus Latescibacterota bacterium]